MKSVSFKDTPCQLIIKMENDVDNLFVLKYKESILKLIKEKRRKIVVLDLSATTFIDSSGIGLIIQSYKEVKAYDGKYALCGINKNIKKTIAISGLANSINTYEEIYENIKECVVNQL